MLSGVQGKSANENCYVGSRLTIKPQTLFWFGRNRAKHHEDEVQYVTII